MYKYALLKVKCVNSDVKYRWPLPLQYSTSRGHMHQLYVYPSGGKRYHRGINLWGFNLRGFPANLPRMHHLLKTRGYKPPWLYNLPPWLFPVLTIWWGFPDVLLSNKNYYSSKWSAFMPHTTIMVNKTIEIETAEADKKILLMHKNI